MKHEFLDILALCIAAKLARGRAIAPIAAKVLERLEGAK